MVVQEEKETRAGAPEKRTQPRIQPREANESKEKREGSKGGEVTYPLGWPEDGSERDCVAEQKDRRLPYRHWHHYCCCFDRCCCCQYCCCR